MMKKRKLKNQKTEKALNWPCYGGDVHSKKHHRVYIWTGAQTEFCASTDGCWYFQESWCSLWVGVHFCNLSWCPLLLRKANCLACFFLPVRVFYDKSDVEVFKIALVMFCGFMQLVVSKVLPTLPQSKNFTCALHHYCQYKSNRPQFSEK